MNTSEFVRQCTLGGPGHDGYVYQADVYCVDCGAEIARNIARKVAPALAGTDDPEFSDSEVCPQPIFFGEADTAQHCGHCGEFMYGDDLGDIEDDSEDFSEED